TRRLCCRHNHHHLRLHYSRRSPCARRARRRHRGLCAACCSPVASCCWPRRLPVAPPLLCVLVLVRIPAPLFVVVVRGALRCIRRPHYRCTHQCTTAAAASVPGVVAAAPPRIRPARWRRGPPRHHRRFRAGRPHRRHLRCPRKPASASLRGLHGCWRRRRRPAHHHHRHRKLSWLPVRCRRARAHGPHACPVAAPRHFHSHRDCHLCRPVKPPLRCLPGRPRRTRLRPRFDHSHRRHSPDPHRRRHARCHRPLAARHLGLCRLRRRRPHLPQPA
ncbi:hypothetical protein HK405_015980, partial [Cladochytrium tenue]